MNLDSHFPMFYSEIRCFESFFPTHIEVQRYSAGKFSMTSVVTVLPNFKDYNPCTQFIETDDCHCHRLEPIQTKGLRNYQPPSLHEELVSSNQIWLSFWNTEHWEGAHQGKCTKGGGRKEEEENKSTPLSPPPRQSFNVDSWLRTLLPLFAAVVSCSWHEALPVWDRFPERTALFYWLLRQSTHH